jgi:protein-tyrosine phosphatase
LLGTWIGNKEIPDPYKQSKHVYELADSLIIESVTSWMKYL